MGVDRMLGRAARQQRWDGLRNLGVGAGRGYLEADGVAGADRIDCELAAARDRLGGEQHHVEQELDPVLRQ